MSTILVNMGQPTLLAGSTLAHETVERIVRAGLDPAARVLALEVLSSSPGRAALGLDLEGGERVVIKVHDDEKLRAFDVEAHQLEHLARKSPLRVPRVLAHGKGGAAGPYAFLILERLPGLPWGRVKPLLSVEEAAVLEWRLGTLLGRMHREARGDRFAEVLPQPSRGLRSWPELFARLWQQRFDDLLCTDRLDTPVLDALAWIHANLSKLLVTEDTPRLVHGNLGPTKILCEKLPGPGGGWRPSGFLDPALAYAHREVDLAALELSSAVSESFFEGYASELPLEAGYDGRKPIYMLYATLDRVRLAGATHDILGAIDLVRDIVRRWGSRPEN